MPPSRGGSRRDPAARVHGFLPPIATPSRIEPLDRPKDALNDRYAFEHELGSEGSDQTPAFYPADAEPEPHLQFDQSLPTAFQD